MSCRELLVPITFLLAASAPAPAQEAMGSFGPAAATQPPAACVCLAPSLAPSLAAAALLPGRSSFPPPPEARSRGPGSAQPAGAETSLLVTAVVLAGASFGGLWAGAQIPFAPADDDSDLSVWHLLTAPAASVVTVTVAATLLGRDGSSSLRGALLGAGAGVAAALLASMSTDDTGILLTYAGVHGLVSALTMRQPGS